MSVGHPACEAVGVVGFGCMDNTYTCNAYSYSCEDAGHLGRCLLMHSEACTVKHVLPCLLYLSMLCALAFV